MIQTIGELEKIITHLTQEEQKLVVRAAKLSEKLHEGQLRESGDPYFVHPLQVAEVLAEMRLDGATICGALLHDVLEDTSLTRQDLRRDFGKEVELLVNGVTKIALVKSKNKNVQESATIRKMLFAMVKDIRVILIKLADKLHNMRTLGYKKADRQRSIAQETLDIYAPLAGRLGISWMKDELEDLSLKHLNNEMYQEIRRYVADKRGERAAYLERVKEAIYQAAEEEDLSVVVETRAKHF